MRATILGLLMASPVYATSYNSPPFGEVTNGAFTTIYVYSHPSTETWEANMARYRPDAAQFSRAAIDAFTEKIMTPGWPSYFDSLFQYNGINPPKFFGSAVASQACVDAALHDAYNGVLQADTIRSLANCHTAGMDPSTQVNLIFGPDIKIANYSPVGGHAPEMCANSQNVAWHGGGLNVPNHTALPTRLDCVRNFDQFTQSASHEMVETLSDPNGMQVIWDGKINTEIGDLCEKPEADRYTLFAGYSLSRYWSNADNNCQPRLDPPVGSQNSIWVLGEGSPLQRFTGDVHQRAFTLPQFRVVTEAAATQVSLVIKTGGDDLRGGHDNHDNADATLNFVGGSSFTANINQGRHWNNGETNSVILNIPAGLRVSDITGVTLTTHFGGGLSGDNWNVDKIALVVSCPTGSVVHAPPTPMVHSWLNASSNPLVRFTGDTHDKQLPVAAQDIGFRVTALDIVISTGNDDLRGGGDNCDVIVELTSGQVIRLNNVNGSRNWGNWTINKISIPLPAGGLRGGDVRSVTLHTGFGGGIGGDNWNVNRVQLLATIVPIPVPPPRASYPSVASAYSPATNYGGTARATNIELARQYALRYCSEKGARDCQVVVAEPTGCVSLWIGTKARGMGAGATDRDAESWGRHYCSQFGQNCGRFASICGDGAN